MGKSLYVLVGRGGGHEGIFLSTSQPKSFLRKRDKWLEWLRKYASGALILAIEIDKSDRGIALILQKSGIKEKILISWIGRLSYFAHEVDGKIAFKSWSHIRNDLCGFSVFDQVGRRSIDLSQEIREIDGDKLIAEEELQASKDRQESKKSKKKIIKINKIKADIEKLSKWIKVKDWLEKNDPSALEPIGEIAFENLKIKFKTNLNAYQKRDFLFKKMKSLRDAESNQIDRLAKEVDDNQPVVHINQLKTISPVWGSLKTQSPKNKTEDQYKTYQFDGFSIGVGNTAEGNDNLRKNWARADDVWVHAANEKSAHAIIKLNSGVSFNIEMLREAASCILKKSGKICSTLEVVYTQVKYLKSVSGTTGMVIFKKEKRLTIVASEKNHV